MARVGHDLRAGHGCAECGARDLGWLDLLVMLSQPALGSVGLAHPVVGFLRCGGQGGPGFFPAVDAVLPEGLVHGGGLREEGTDGLGGADGVEFRREELRDQPAGVL